jgi:hypothetical protein
LICCVTDITQYKLKPPLASLSSFIVGGFFKYRISVNKLRTQIYPLYDE